MIPKLKCRAWDGERMHYPSDGEYLALFSGPKQVPWRIYDRHGTMIMDGQYEGVLMLCTGLKDVEGNDIYEGDIVTSVHGLSPIPQDGGPTAWVERPERRVVPQMGSVVGYGFLAHYGRVCDDVKLTVVGNVYENP